MPEPRDLLANRAMYSEPDNFPTMWENLLVSTPAFLEQFDRTYAQWEEMNRRGVRFPKSVPHVAIRSGWSAARKAPVPFVALSQATLSPRGITLFGVDLPKQEITHKRLFGLADTETTISYVNLDKGLQWETTWAEIRDIRWHVLRPLDGIGRIPLTQHFIRIDSATAGTSTILLQCTPKIERSLNISPEELERRTEEKAAESLQRTQSLFTQLTEYWHAAVDQVVVGQPAFGQAIPPVRDVAALKAEEQASADAVDEPSEDLTGLAADTAEVETTEESAISAETGSESNDEVTG